MAKESRLGVHKGERGGVGMDGHFVGFLEANSYIWNGWAMGSYCTVQGNVCDWITLLYNRTWWNIVNQVNFNKNKCKKRKESTVKVRTWVWYQDSNLIPGLGTSKCHGRVHKKKSVKLSACLFLFSDRAFIMLIITLKSVSSELVRMGCSSELEYCGLLNALVLTL